MGSLRLDQAAAARTPAAVPHTGATHPICGASCVVKFIETACTSVDIRAGKVRPQAVYSRIFTVRLIRVPPPSHPAAVFLTPASS